MAKQFLVPIDLSDLEIQNVALQKLGNNPDPVTAKIYYNTSSNKIRFYNGSSWVELEDSGGLSGIQTIGGTAPIDVVTSSGNATVSISAATTSAAGSMSSADKTKLDNATASNVNGTLVIRDGSGNFSAGTITASLTGTASNATQLGGQNAAHYLDRANHTGTQLASTISNFDTAVRTSRLDQMATPTANVSLGNNKITNLADPTLDTDAANKKYVDASRTGLDAKESVRAATTTNITLSGVQTIDGVSLVEGDRVLVKNQSTASANGIYVVGSGAWTRATDADSSEEVTSGMFTFVEEGTLNKNTGWVLSTANPIVVGTTALAFVQFSGAGAITAGNGLTQTGTTLSVVGTANRISVSSGGVDIASTYAGQSSITTLGTIGTGTWQGSTVGVPYGGTGRTTLSSGDYLVGNGAGAINTRTAAQVLTDIGASPTSHNHTLDSLSNVTITSNSTGEILRWDGAAWVNSTLAESGIPGAADVVLLTGNQTISGTKTFNSTISGSISGNANTATTLANARTIAISGAITGTATSFDGSANISIPVTAINVGHTGVTGTLGVDHGGTGISSYTANNYIRAAGATTLEQRTPAQVRADIGAAASAHSHALGDLSDVVISGASSSELLGYDGTNWVNVPAPAGSLAGLSDTDISTPANGHILRYNSGSWSNSTLAAAGIAPTVHTHAAGDVTSGTFDIARIPTGTTGSTVALGNHTHGTGDITSGRFVMERMPTSTTANRVLKVGTANSSPEYGQVDWGELTGRPATFPPDTHNHDDRYYTETEIDSRNYTRKYASVLSTSATSYVLTHNFGTRDVVVAVARNAAPYDEVEVDVERTSTNTVTVRFAVAPAANAYTATVVG